ncbi:MAG: putative quinol monooxygenase [Pseudomonadota bacterium]
MYCVTVEFTLKPGAMEAFMPRMRKQRDDSLQLEDGCSTFEIWTGSGQPDRVFLYEIYGSAEDFETHLASDHFKSFAVDIEPLVESRQLNRWDTLA